MRSARPVAAGSLAVDPDWLAKRQEEIIDPGLPIIDPHHHLIDRGFRYLLHELVEDLATGHNIRATVYLEWLSMYRQGADKAMAPVGETEFANGMAAMSAGGGYGPARACSGIVSFADLRLANAEDVLRAHIQAGGGRFRGIRQSAVWHEDPGVSAIADRPKSLLSQADFRAGFAHLAPLGLSFEAWVYHTQLPGVTALARAFPSTTIVLNHFGAPLGIGPYEGKRDAVFAEWRGFMRELATCPNVVVKLGGLGMRMMGFGFEEKDMPPSSTELADAWRPYVEACIEAFGPDHCMFESNFPVDKVYCAYPILWNAFKRLASGASAEDKAQLFFGTAARAYRLDAASLSSS